MNFFFLSILILLFITSSFYYKTNTDQSNNNFYETNISLVFPNKNVLENADIVFRRGYGVDSNIAVNFSEGEKRFSHAGILFKEKTDYFVIHVIDDQDLKIDGIIKTPLSEYLSDIQTWAIYRYDLSEQQRIEIVFQALKLMKINHIKFDHKFDLNTDNEMYCSEFIYKVVNQNLSYKIINAGKTFLGKKFVTISDLYQSTSAQLIQSSHKNLTIKK
ncbi:MAG: hypothetical protein GW906_11255 [Epsilonproteobacteria bacterium]|nr:hypothetical protein [Campylobacterota bacterium]NCO27365.1 hypothetical protein [Campylobacterota bacterium]NCO30795.1 hypothetical protein [Campylobacterota bacterium]NCS70263.1 hypothetical protein [Campylobacterota bacterium]OIO16331.1 MAG: hypothetical protein AUJ81_04695 [Helicobacteraceae bacterium CG1_02_36_14]